MFGQIGGLASSHNRLLTFLPFKAHPHRVGWAFANENRAWPRVHLRFRFEFNTGAGLLRSLGPRKVPDMQWQHVMMPSPTSSLAVRRTVSIEHDDPTFFQIMEDQALAIQLQREEQIMAQSRQHEALARQQDPGTRSACTPTWPDQPPGHCTGVRPSRARCPPCFAACDASAKLVSSCLLSFPDSCQRLSFHQPFLCLIVILPGFPWAIRCSA